MSGYGYGFVLVASLFKRYSTCLVFVLCDGVSQCCVSSSSPSSHVERKNK